MILPPKKIPKATNTPSPQNLIEAALPPPTPTPVPVADPGAVEAALPFAASVCARLPLAEGVLRMLALVLEERFLDDVFARYRGRSYQQVISFPTFVQLLSDALVEHQARGRQSFQRAQEDGTLKASLSALYGKLARVPLTLSQGLLLESSTCLQELFPSAAATPLPNSLAGLNLIAFDGKKIKHVARRLKATRQHLGQLYGGKLVVALWVNTRLALALNAHVDGEVSDTPLLPDLVRQVRSRVGGVRLWIGDRLFCDLDQPRWLCQDGDHFLIRYNRRVSFHPDPDHPPQEGTNGQGQRYVEQIGWIGTAQDPRRRQVRRITLYRPGEEDVILITDLLESQTYPATDLLEAYLMRWEIENCFQQITEVFHRRRLIGTTPEATVFQAAFCLLLYNVVMVQRGYLAEAEQLAAEVISTAQLFYDIRRQLISWQEVLTVAETVSVIQAQPVEETRERLRALARGLWTERWRKSTGTRKPPTKQPKKYPPGGHTSVFRLLQQAKASPDKSG